MAEVLPMRECEGCPNVDDHPRAHLSEGNTVRLYHYDCLPRWARVDAMDPDHPGLVATAEGKRGADVRKAVLLHVGAPLPDATEGDE